MQRENNTEKKIHKDIHKYIFFKKKAKKLKKASK